jgi:hypothetical protein
MMEEWRPVVGYESFYEVSSLGRVARSIYGRRRIKSAWPNDKGYLRLVLCCKGKQRTVSVHQLVARAFVDGYAPGLEVNHKDLNKRHNEASNLEWVTGDGNRQHYCAAHGFVYPSLRSTPRALRVRAAPRPLLGRRILHSESTVEAIRAIGRSQTSRTIAQLFGLSKSQVNRILSGENRARAT